MSHHSPSSYSLMRLQSQPLQQRETVLFPGHCRERMWLGRMLMVCKAFTGQRVRGRQQLCKFCWRQAPTLKAAAWEWLAQLVLCFFWKQAMPDKLRKYTTYNIDLLIYDILHLLVSQSRISCLFGFFMSPEPRQLNFGDLEDPSRWSPGRDLKGRSALHWAATFGHLEASEARRTCIGHGLGSGDV